MLFLKVGHLRHELLREVLDPIGALPPDLIEPLVLLGLKRGHLRLMLRPKGFQSHLSGIGERLVLSLDLLGMHLLHFGNLSHELLSHLS
jgi:hypothetical protein